MPAIPSSTMFHLILEGVAQVKIAEQNLRLSAGDFILLPKGLGHDIIDTLNTPANDLFEQNLIKVNDHYETLTCLGSGSTTTLCGTVLFESSVTQSILRSMPDYILIKKEDASSELITNLIKAIKSAAASNFYGAELVIEKLADALLIQCVRFWIEQSSGQNNKWLMAHSDPRLSPVISKIHNQPAESIDIETLAKLCFMSRTSFINYFKQVVGLPPKKYITDWRLSLARERLKASHDHIISVALEVGYQSEAAFSRAYKARFDESPSDTKNRHNKPSC
ncbi:AraC family transcriptional regulator [Marinomonas epiphytica]